MWSNTNTNICYSNNIRILFEYRIIRSPLILVNMWSYQWLQIRLFFFLQKSYYRIRDPTIDIAHKIAFFKNNFGEYVILPVLERSVDSSQPHQTWTQYNLPGEMVQDLKIWYLNIPKATFKWSYPYWTYFLAKILFGHFS